MSFEGAAISLGATVISLAFASLVFAQWLGRRRRYQLAWSLRLGLYGIAAFMQFLAEAYGWSVTVYKIYYLVAAPLVAVLGIGSVFLVHRRAGIGFALYTVAIFIGFAAAVAGATVNTNALASAIPVAGTALPANGSSFSPLSSVPGSVARLRAARPSTSARSSRRTRPRRTSSSPTWRKASSSGRTDKSPVVDDTAGHGPRLWAGCTPHSSCDRRRRMPGSWACSSGCRSSRH